MNRFADGVHRTSKLLSVVGACVLLGIMALTVANIIYRLTGHVIIGTYELVQFLMVVPAAFALGYTAVEKGHIEIGLVVSRLTPRGKRICQATTKLISIGVLGFICAATAWFIVEKTNTVELTDLVHLPINPFRGIWLLGLIVFAIALVVDLVRPTEGEGEELHGAN